MSHFAATTTPHAPRKIEEFRSIREFLRAIHDAIESHQRQYFATGQIHGNINAETVYIGSPSPVSNRRGFLIESSIVQKLFQSVNVLSRTVLVRNTTVPVDYLDDLESFYYIIAWVSMVYTAPGTRLQVHEFPTALADWAAVPDHANSALEKESMLQGHGFGGELPPSTLNQQDVLPNDVFEALLGEFHSILKENYFKKWANVTEDCTKIYGRIIQLLRLSINALPSWA